MQTKSTSAATWTAPRAGRFDLELEIQAPAAAGGAYVPVELPDIRLAARRIDPGSFWVTAYDAHGAPLVFDPAAPAPACYKIPSRFDPDYEGRALPLQPRRGRLVFLAQTAERRQRFSIYFNSLRARHVPECAPEYGGLIGDGDVFTQRTGPLAVPGQARPVLWGAQLCGRRGMVVASSMAMGIYFFEDISRGRSPVLVNRGPLRDVEDNIIGGIPAFHDLSGSGLLDLVTGRDDGRLEWHRNTGTAADPRFAPPRTLCGIDGRPLEIKPFLEGKFINVKDRHGRPNRRYPRMPLIVMHGGRCHLNPVPLFAPGRQAGACDLIVGTRGGFFVWFRHTPAGFEQGRLLQDVSGKPLRVDAVTCFPTCAPDARPGRIVMWSGDYYGRVFRIVQAGFDRDAPVFHPPRPANIPDEVEYSFPLALAQGRRQDLLVGDFRGHVKYFRQTGRNRAGDQQFDAGQPVTMSNAWIVHHMPVAHYTDLNGDGVRDIVSGDVKGGVYGYRNLGSNVNPCFDAGRLLRAGEMPLKIQGGPDPHSPADGYSKPLAADLSGAGHPDLLIGTGLGRIMHYPWAGLDADGLPGFRKGRVLRDTRGQPIRCHHMSGLELADWDGDGVPDLIVGGQSRVHAFQDDDGDPSQVRFYKGIRQGGRLRFLPYQAISAEGDNLFCNRPVALSVINAPDGRRLLVNRMCFRQPDPRRPTLVEFEKFLPPLLIHGRAKCPGAYGTVSSLHPGDPLTVEGSVVGSLFAFRVTFAALGGYPAARLRRNRPYAPGGRPGRLDPMPPVPPPAPEQIQHRVAGRLPVRRLADDLKLDRKFIRAAQEWPGMELQKVDNWMMPKPDGVIVRAGANRQGLFLLVDVVEPLMERLICWTDHRNGPLESDDRVEILLDFNAAPATSNPHMYFCMINHRGFFKEMNLRRRDAEPEGPWRVGRRPIQVISSARQDGFQLAVKLAWEKWNLPWPAALRQCRIEIKRRRHLYSNEVRAKEQRLSAVSSLSGGEWAWTRLAPCGKI